MPASAQQTRDPSDAYVGPYWFVRDDSGGLLVIAHTCALADAEQYGACLTSPHGHYELWEGWRTGRPPHGMAGVVRDAEYEEWPRGRVVFDAVRSRFLVYADSQIFRDELLQRVLDQFGIPREMAMFQRDEHYVSTRKLFDSSGSR